MNSFKNHRFQIFLRIRPPAHHSSRIIILSCRIMLHHEITRFIKDPAKMEANGENHAVTIFHPTFNILLVCKKSG